MNLTSKILFSLLFLFLTGCTLRHDLDVLTDELAKQSHINGCMAMFINLKQGDHLKDDPFESGQATLDYCEEGARKFLNKINKK